MQCIYWLVSQYTNTVHTHHIYTNNTTVYCGSMSQSTTYIPATAAGAVTSSAMAVFSVVTNLVIVGLLVSLVAISGLLLRDNVTGVTVEPATCSCDLSDSNNTEVVTAVETQTTDLSSNFSGEIQSQTTTLDTSLQEVKTSVEANRLETDILGNFRVAVQEPQTAFGELSVAAPTQTVDINFLYNDFRADVTELFLAGGGACTADGALATCTIETGIGDYAVVRTLRRVRYRPGLGALGRFTAVFSPSVALATQQAGIGNAGNGFFFGYNGAQFSILHRRGGRHEVWQLLVNTAATATENLVINVEGVNYTVPLTDATGAASTTAFTAYEIGNCECITGYSLTARDNSVTIFRSNIGPATGPIYIVSSGTADVNVTQIAAGVGNTDVWIAQESWNVDVMDGNGTSGMTLDPHTGNVYQIRYQWLGFGNINFYIEDKETGKFLLVHTIKYSNSYTVPSVEIPSFPFQWAVASLGSTTAMNISFSSAAGFVEGPLEIEPPFYSAETSETVSSTNTETNVICIRLRAVQNGIVTSSTLTVNSATVSNDGNGVMIVRMYYLVTDLGDGTVTDYPTWTNAGGDVVALVEYEATSDTLTGGQLVYTDIVFKNSRTVIDLTNRNFRLERLQTFCITIESTAVTTVNAAISWNEVL